MTTLPDRLLAFRDAAESTNDDEGNEGCATYVPVSLQTFRDAMDEAAAALSGGEAVAADWKMEVKPSASDAEILAYLDELLDVQGRLMFAKGNAPEPLGEVFGVAILDFMRLHGMRVREIIRASLGGGGTP